MSEGPGATEARWRSRFTWLPLVVLGLAAALALATGPYTGATDSRWRLVTQVVVLLLTAGVLVLRTTADDRLRSDPRLGRGYYVLRTCLAVLLTALNPLFCVFAWVGFIDGPEYLSDRGTRIGLVVTAATMAWGQAGGAPGENVFRWLLFGILLIVNMALAFTMTAWSRHLADTSESRARAIAELEAVNGELERAVAENAALRDRLVARAREAGVDEERQRLAREIHDGIAQSLAGIVTQLQAEIAATGPGGRTGAALALAREALTDARRSVLDLGPVQLSGSDLPTALRAEAEMWSRRSGVQVDVRVVGEEVALHQEVEATVLRVVQEALANCRKHAAARRVGVTLSYDQDEIMVDVRDDGRGFDPERVAEPGTFGLRGMRQRAERLAGVLEIESGAGDGTAVSLRLPALERGAA